MAFWIVARRLGPHWALDDEESRALGLALANLWDALPIPDTESGLIKATAVLSATLSETVAGKVAEGKLRALMAQRPEGVSETEYMDAIIGATIAGMTGMGTDGTA